MRILGLVRSLIKEEGITAVMVIHDLNLAARFCDRLVLLHNRNIYAEGKPEDVLSPQNLKVAYEVEVEIGYKPSIGSLQVVVIN